MIKHLFRVRWLGVVLAVLLLLICLSASGGAYLPLIGTPPLRFEAAAVHARAFSWISPVTVKPAAPAETNSPPEISTASKILAAAIPLMDLKTNAPNPSLPENLSTNSTADTHSANDLLVVTPEMLVDYFKPGTDATNQTNVRVLAPVGFMPPPAVASPSSEAIYRSQ
jgi:hypothetical protein